MKSTKRKYELKKRAERQDETRQRIVEAAVALHEQLGPSQTSISAIAERAGVGRPTVYRHFPDERSLFAACTTHYLDQHQVPEWERWRGVIDPRTRLRRGLVEIYRWYRETEQMSSVTFRDLPEVPALAEVLEPHFAGFAAARAILSEGWSASNPVLLDAAIGHALDFSTWRSLARDHRIDDETVADLMTSMVVAAAQPAVASAA
ncbi:MAG: TetR/AcrR family transcriptional regulator [Thermomicrobiales bacterium]